MIFPSSSPAGKIDRPTHSADLKKVLYQAAEDTLNVKERSKTMTFMNSGYWFVWDPCGIVCAVLTYLLILYGEVVVLIVLVPPFPSLSTGISVTIFSSLATLAVVSHVKAMMTDPGIVSKESSSEEEVLERRQNGEDIRYCKKCRSIKPDRAHHCSTCERCIQRMDHHCPWINNCVGENNQKFFVLFTFYIMLMSVFGLGMVALFFFRCVGTNFDGCDGIMPGPLAFILTLIGVFEGFLFSLFTCIMFCTQVYAIAADETGIESLKRDHRQRISWSDSFEEVCGSRMGIRWLNPFTPAPNFSSKLKRRILLSGIWKLHYKVMHQFIHVVVFNSGNHALQPILEHLGVHPGPLCTSYLVAKDKERLKKAELRERALAKKRRKSKRAVERSAEESHIEEEGMSIYVKER